MLNTMYLVGSGVRMFFFGGCAFFGGGDPVSLAVAAVMIAKITSCVMGDSRPIVPSSPSNRIVVSVLRRACEVMYIQ